MTFQHRPDVRETIRMCHSWNGTIARCKPFPKRKRLELDKDENMDNHRLSSKNAINRTCHANISNIPFFIFTKDAKP